MKKYILISLSIAYTHVWAWDGNGTESNPYLIQDAHDFITLSEKAAEGNTYKGKYFKVVNSIEFETVGIEEDESGSNFVPIKEFAGHFNGNGHQIKHMSIKQSSEDYVAIFKKLTGSIEHLEIKDNCKIIGKNYVACLVAQNMGSISYCYNYAKISGGNNVGGIVAVNTGNLTECVNHGKITGSEKVGGVVGETDDYTDATQCLNTGEVTGTGDYVGGIVGKGVRFQAFECINKGSVSGVRYVGGIVGYHDASTTALTMNIKDCTNEGTVSGTTRVGGIAGFHDGPMAGCTNSGVITGTDEQVGGIAGYSKTGNTSNCINSGTVTGKNNVAGIIGYVNTNIFVNNCQNNGDITGVSYVGGITGYGNIINGGTNSGKITGISTVGGITGVGKVYEQSSNSGEIVGIEDESGTLDGSGIGGIIGGGTVSDAINTGSVTANNTDEGVGGIAGYGTMTNCINKGNVTANSESYAGIYYVGGIVGKGSATNCENEGVVSGKIRYAGGITGCCTDNGQVKGCTNKANVSGRNTVGAVIGWYSSGSLSENYYTQNVIVKAGDTEYSGTTPRGVGDAYGYTPYDITENNGAVLKADPAGISILTQQKSADVYNLSGVKVRKTATSLNGLRKDIYIVNGKKVIK